MKFNSRNLLAWMAALLASPFLLLLIYLYVLLPLGNFRAKQDGHHVIALVEKYKLEHGKLPATLSDIGLEDKEDAPIQYTTEDDNEYLVWFSDFGVGESITYDSKTKTWSDEKP